MRRSRVVLICLVQHDVDNSTGIEKYIRVQFHSAPSTTSPLSDRQVYVHMHLYYTLCGRADFRVW